MQIVTAGPLARIQGVFAAFRLASRSGLPHHSPQAQGPDRRMDSLFFIVAKLVGMLIRCDTWLVILVASVTLALLRNKYAAARRRSILLLLYVLLLGFVPVGSLLLQPLERRYTVNPDLPEIDGIVILGGAENAVGTQHWDQVQLNDAGERFFATAVLAGRYPDVPVLFTGGNGSLRGLIKDRPSESETAERLLLDLGVAPDRLLLEPNSRNTTENARFGRQIARPGPNETWVLVTSAYHMPRAMGSFEAAGWPTMIPWPVDFRTSTVNYTVYWNLLGYMKTLNIALKEWVGLLAYGVTGH